MALRSSATIVGYGGAAGAGKTNIASLVGALRYGGHPGFTHTIFRKTRPEHLQPGGVWDQLAEFLPRIFPGSRPNASNLSWRLPAGGSIRCEFLDRPEHRLRYMGGATPFVSFDEATHFDEGDALYLVTRQRSTSGVPCQMYLATNPGGPGHDWFFRWFGPWLDPKHALYPTAAGEKRYFRYAHDDKGQPVRAWLPGYVHDPVVKSITFIPGRLEDNPILTHHNPGYEGNLMAVDRVTSMQLRMGDWLIRHMAGTTFSRTGFQVQPVAGRFMPDNMVRKRVRFWDRAGIEGGGDFTAGVLMALIHGDKPRYVIEDVIAVQWSVDKIPDLIWSIAGVKSARDRLEQKLRLANQWTGARASIPLISGSFPVDPPGTVVADEQSPADAGLERAVNFLKEARTHGIPARVLTLSERGSKYSHKGVDIAARMAPLAVESQNGMVYILRGPWNDHFLDGAQAFDGDKNGGYHDDEVDAAAGAYQLLSDFARNGRFTLGRDR